MFELLKYGVSAVRAQGPPFGHLFGAARSVASVASVAEVLIFIGVKLILAHHYTIEPVDILSTPRKKRFSDEFFMGTLKWQRGNSAQIWWVILT